MDAARELFANVLTLLPICVVAAFDRAVSLAGICALAPSGDHPGRRLYSGRDVSRSIG
ncbi:MAG: hypothetical protein L6R19_29205 [Alphaproteobacteria bacterium]|nr:hypothetical protein [Alphaproteobacteria bacterium]